MPKPVSPVRLKNKRSDIIILEMDHLPAPHLLSGITNSCACHVPDPRVTNLEPRLSIPAPDLFFFVPQKSTLYSRAGLASSRHRPHPPHGGAEPASRLMNPDSRPLVRFLQLPKDLRQIPLPLASFFFPLAPSLFLRLLSRGEDLNCI